MDSLIRWIHSSLRLFEETLGISISASDVVASVLGAVVIILISRSASAARSGFLILSLVFKRVRSMRIRQNAAEILNGIRYEALLRLLILRASASILGIVLMALILLMVNLYQIQDAISQSQGVDIEHFNSLFYWVAVEYQYWIKLLITAAMTIYIIDFLASSSKIEAILLIQRYGLDWFPRRRSTLASWSYLTEGKYTKSIAVTTFALIIVFIVIGAMR